MFVCLFLLSDFRFVETKFYLMRWALNCSITIKRQVRVHKRGFQSLCWKRTRGKANTGYTFCIPCTNSVTFLCTRRACSSCRVSLWHAIIKVNSEDLANERFWHLDDTCFARNFIITVRKRECLKKTPQTQIVQQLNGYRKLLRNHCKIRRHKNCTASQIENIHLLNEI